MDEFGVLVVAEPDAAVEAKLKAAMEVELDAAVEVKLEALMGVELVDALKEELNAALVVELDTALGVELKAATVGALGAAAKEVDRDDDELDIGVFEAMAVLEDGETDIAELDLAVLELDELDLVPLEEAPLGAKVDTSIDEVGDIRLKVEDVECDVVSDTVEEEDTLETAPATRTPAFVAPL